MYPVTKDFLGKPAPPGYVAGLGRGATGFTTRSDIGPAREPTTQPSNKAQSTKATTGEPADDSDRYADADEKGLFSNTPYEADDEEADRIWESIDKQMEGRRKPRDNHKENSADTVLIGQQLKGLKRQLGEVTEDQWNSIPDVTQVAETAARAKRRRGNQVSRRGERFSQVSDSSLMAALGVQQIASGTAVVEDDGVTDFSAISQARNDVLRMSLDREKDRGGEKVDPQGYLTSLSTLGSARAAEIGDIGRARELLRSVTLSNPKHAPGWIALARVEEMAQKTGKAREVISEACDRCPKSEDIWLEAARLHAPKEARSILASAARNVPKSVRIWVAAAELESGDARKRILRRALEHIPTSVVLWKEAVSLEDDPSDARILLSHAVELVPLSVDLWLALAKLETRENAQKVLNKARRAIPDNADVWVAAARLEEQHGQADRVRKIMAKAVASLHQIGSMDREKWLQHAVSADADGYPETSKAIVRASSSIGFDDDDADADRAAAWLADADKVVGDSVVCARELYACALDLLPAREDIWRSAADFEAEHGGDAGLLKELLARAVSHCPGAEVLWLMAAKHAWVSMGDVRRARDVLEAAFAANPESEAILLAAVKLEDQTGQPARALALLQKARAMSFVLDDGRRTQGTPRIWMKSACLLRQLNDDKRALEIATEALARFPRFWKLWLVKAQILVVHQRDAAAAAKQTYSMGLKHCRDSVPLWIGAAKLEQAAGSPTRARAILERARVYVPRNPALWLASVRLEADAASLDVARTLLARALQECPKAGVLWAESILLADRPQRKARSVDALKNAEANDPHVIVMVARLFWSESKIDKARSWFERACAADPDCGDAWAWRLAFELEARDKERAAAAASSALAGDQRVEAVENACAKADPHHGELWAAVAKDPANAKLSPRDVLYKTVDALGKTRQLL
ncbi:U4/U6 x U5 tri-snRNP complex subunit Prp1 [Coemansia sp. RSA 2599]|nr:U4/U6 x U5 tri-snRNP complex subunit Prp1 [Coemansia sp. RSA 2598]KAJ1829043.1 U4/U6 x U5 tri-snRNP complex subunit Prp1 [Coemansia sp. RSA 2599]